MEDLSNVVSMLEKKFGEGILMRLDDELGKNIEVIPSGSLGIDIALGVGGIPVGRIIEIFGPESSGKTTIALHIAAETQKLGGTVVFIDAEHALDVKYARQLGIDTKKLLVSQPDFGEQAFEIAEALLNTNKVDLIVIDSVAALTPRAELEGEIYDQQPGMQARLMSKALRKLTAVASKSKTTIIFINQIRMKIGVMFGSPETTTGGNALKFYASVRLDVRRVGPVKDSTEVTGNRVRVKVVKNKVSPPFKEVEFDVIFNEGISKEGELLDLGVEHGVVDKAGSWYAFQGEKLGQGRDSARIFLKQNPPIAQKIENLILEKAGIARNVFKSCNQPMETKELKRKKTG
ncbi:MAG: recombinase RecA [Deltaproteobacteria bacterium]|nr:recombinase RecA [Deltaproteobacteria bacterium]